jgi:hypothetical protein
MPRYLWPGHRKHPVTATPGTAISIPVITDRKEYMDVKNLRGKIRHPVYKIRTKNIILDRKILKTPAKIL